MLVVDAQVHIWAAETSARPWLPGGASYAHQPVPIDSRYLLQTMDRVGVDRALLVSPTWEGHRNDVVLEAATAYPDRFGAIVRFNLQDEGSADRLEHLYADARVFGARTVFVRESRSWISDGTADWFWGLAERLQMPVMVFAPGQLERIVDVVEQHPGLRVAICHLGMDISLRDREIGPHVERVLELAKFPNVAVKATSLPSFVTDPYPFASLHDHIRRVVEAFGPRRVFWGSDLSRLRCDYSELYDLFMYELAFLSNDDREWIMGRGVCEWFNWEVPPGAHR